MPHTAEHRARIGDALRLAWCPDMLAALRAGCEAAREAGRRVDWPALGDRIGVGAETARREAIRRGWHTPAYARRRSHNPAT